MGLRPELLVSYEPEGLFLSCYRKSEHQFVLFAAGEQRDHARENHRGQRQAIREGWNAGDG